MKNTAIADRQTRNQHHTEKMWKEETRTTEDGRKLTAEMLAETTIDEHHNAETKRTITITDKR
jgi:methylthioribose-1-phosphate isomerase